MGYAYGDICVDEFRCHSIDEIEIYYMLITCLLDFCPFCPTFVTPIKDSFFLDISSLLGFCPFVLNV